MQVEQLPIPPIELRRAIGGASFDNPSGDSMYDEVPAEAYERVFDFGCGCGRLARQMMLLRQIKPKRYFGVDLHKAAIEWASQNLSPINPDYRFEHLDLFNRQFNPSAIVSQLPFPTRDTFTLVIAHSVFTHILETDVAFFMSETARILAPGGYFVSTWFFFDKRHFPMMQEFQNALYVQLADPTNAVIYDLEFVRRLFRSVGLTIVSIKAPQVRGFQWRLAAVHSDGRPEVAFPDDNAPFGVMRPPIGMSG